jgi:hypothetical protein
MKQSIILLCAVIALNACTSSLEVAQSSGERVTVSRGGVQYEAELLEVSDSALYLLSQGGVLQVPIDEVSAIEVLGFSLQKAKLVPALTVAGFEVIAIAAYLGSDYEFKDPGFPIFMFGFPPVLAAFAYFTGDPEVSFSPPFDANDLEKLRLYSRYPQGLTPDQRQRLSQTLH